MLAAREKWQNTTLNTSLKYIHPVINHLELFYLHLGNNHACTYVFCGLEPDFPWSLILMVKLKGYFKSLLNQVCGEKRSALIVIMHNM